jgi:hypothetical protein
VWTIGEDHARRDLLFVGTEFGVFFTVDGGQRWVQLRSGLPVIPVRDLAIHTRTSDLVLATFGRGFYVLDDYSPLRALTPALLAVEATLLPVRPAEMYFPTNVEAGSQGQTFFTAPNPPVGATFTYYLGRALRSRRDARRERERAAARRGEDTPYPSWDSLRAEDREEPPAIVLTITDEAGTLIRQLTGPTGTGLHRVTWDLRWPSTQPVTSPARAGDDDEGGGGGGFFGGGGGPITTPGGYRVSLNKRVDGVLTPLGEPQAFSAEPIGTPSLPWADRAALLAFQRQTASLQRAVLGAAQVTNEALTQVRVLRTALDQTPSVSPALRTEAGTLESRLLDLQVRLSGDRTMESRSEPAAPGIVDRIQNVVSGHWQTTANPTATHRRDYEIAASEFGQFLPVLRQLVETDLKALFARAEAAGVPWTPGRVPTWP